MSQTRATLIRRGWCSHVPVAAMCLRVPGAARPPDWFGEAVCAAEQHCQLPGALQHPATGQQSDQVRHEHQ